MTLQEAIKHIERVHGDCAACKAILAELDRLRELYREARKQIYYGSPFARTGSYEEWAAETERDLKGE